LSSRILYTLSVPINPDSVVKLPSRFVVYLRQNGMIELKGQIERVTYYNEENGYAIARFKAEGRADLVTIVGSLLGLNPGEALKLKGEWQNHSKYGQQFRIISYETAVPATAAGIERYLRSGMIKGIGPVMAKRLVSSFGIGTFKTGDKVMQIRNNYDKDVYNGDIGRIIKIDREEQEVYINFDGKLTSYDFSELDELVLAYATSVHKAQGSEYPAVVIPILIQHYVLLQRNLLYTGITRGKKLVVLVGTKKALAIAVHNNKPQLRYTLLKERLQRV